MEEEQDKPDTSLSERQLSIPSTTSLLKPLPSPLLAPLDTYIVQYPKDQIYRVPPPDHAIIVERHRSPVRKERTRCKRVLWIVLGLVAICALLGIIFFSIYRSFNPELPVFSVKSISKSSSKRYKITLEATNPNGNMGVDYLSNGEENDATSVLSYKNLEIGKGKSTPEFINGKSEDSTNVVVFLGGTDKKLPDEIQVDSKHALKSSHPISLNLGLSLRAKFNVGALRLWSKNLNVECSFKVSGLKRTDTKILTQQCKSN